MSAKQPVADHEIFRAVREYSGLTIAEIAKLTGINMATVSLFETGKVELSEEQKKKLDVILKKIWTEAEAKRKRLNKAVMTSAGFPISAQVVSATVGSGKD